MAFDPSTAVAVDEKPKFDPSTAVAADDGPKMKFDPSTAVSQGDFISQKAKDRTFDPVAYAAQDPKNLESAYAIEKARAPRSAGEWTADAASTAVNPQTYANAGKGLWNFASGLVGAPLSTAYQLGNEGAAVVGKSLADDGLPGAQDFANASERRAQTAKAQAVLAEQTVGSGLQNLGRVADKYVNPVGYLEPADVQEANRRNDFNQRVQQYSDQQKLAAGQPLDTGNVADFVTATQGENPASAYSPESLKRAGAAPVDQSVVAAESAAADPTNLLIPMAGEIPYVRQAAGGLVEGAGKALQVPGKLASSIPGKIGKLASGGLSAGAAAEALFHPAIAAKIGAGVAAAKGLQWLGDAFEAQGGAMRTGVPSALDTESAVARLTGDSSKNADAKRLIGNAAASGVATAAGMAPLNAATSEGDPNKFAESTVGAGVFGSAFDAFTSKRPALVEAARPYLRMKGEQSMNTNDAEGRKSAAFINTLPEAQRNSTMELMGTLQGLPSVDEHGNKNPSRMLVLNNADYQAAVNRVVQQSGSQNGAAIGGGRGFFYDPSGTAVINGESSSFSDPNEAAHTMGHEFGGHAAVNMLRASTSRGGPIYDGLFNAVRGGLLTADGRPTVQFRNFVDGYNQQYGSQRLNVNDPEAMHEFVAETAGQIIAGKGAAEIALPKNLLDRATDRAGQFMSSLIGLDSQKIGTPTHFNREEVGSITQAVKDTLTQLAGLNLREGQNQGIPAQTSQERIGELNEILARPKPPATAPAEDVAQWAKDQRAAKAELAIQQQGNTATFPANGAAPVPPSAPGVPVSRVSATNGSNGPAPVPVPGVPAATTPPSNGSNGNIAAPTHGVTPELRSKFIEQYVDQLQPIGKRAPATAKSLQAKEAEATGMVDSFAEAMQDTGKVANPGSLLSDVIKFSFDGTLPSDAQKVPPIVGKKGVTFTAPTGRVLVKVDTQKLDNAWSKDGEFYLPPGTNDGRTKRFDSYLKSNTSVEAPSVGLLPDGRVGFDDGRHRFSYFRDRGDTETTIAVDPSQVKDIQNKFGLTPESQNGEKKQVSTTPPVTVPPTPPVPPEKPPGNGGSWKPPEEPGLTSRQQRRFDPKTQTVGNQELGGVAGTRINRNNPDDAAHLAEALKNAPNPALGDAVVKAAEDSIANGKTMDISYDSAELSDDGIKRKSWTRSGATPTDQERNQDQKLSDIGLADKKTVQKDFAPQRIEIHETGVPRFDDASVSKAKDAIDAEFANPRNRKFKAAGFPTSDAAKEAVAKLAEQRAQGGGSEGFTEKQAELLHDVLKQRETHLYLVGDSPDKTVANAMNLAKAMSDHTSDPAIATAADYLKGNQWQKDLVKRRENMANGYRGDGKEFIGIQGGEAGAQPTNPDFTPYKLPDFKVQVLNLIEGGAGNTYFPEAKANLPTVDADPTLARPRPEELPGKSANPLEDKLAALGKSLKLPTKDGGTAEGLNKILTEATEKIRLDRIKELRGTDALDVPPSSYPQRAAGFMPETGGSERAPFSEDNRLTNIIARGSGIWNRIVSDNPQVKDKPEMVTVYRATIGNELRHNDYVALNRSVAVDHLKNLRDRGEKGRVQSHQVRLDDLLMANDSTEFVYSPKSKEENASFMPDTSMKSDMTQQRDWMDREAKSRGYSGLGAMLSDKPESVTKMGAQWRVYHARDKQGTFLQDKAVSAINTALYGSKNTAENTPETGRGIAGESGALDDAETFLQRGNGSGSQAPGSQQGQADKNKLVEWANGNGVLLDSFPKKFNAGSEKNVGGSEHDAFHDQRSGRWVKFTKGNGNTMGKIPVANNSGFNLENATPEQYIQSRNDWNQLFGDDIRLHGVVKDKFGNVSVVTSQPDIKGEPVSEDQISDSMNQAGFESFGNDAFYRASDNSLVYDLHPENAVQKDGVLIPFDGGVMHPEYPLIEAMRNAKKGAVPKSAAFMPDSDYRGEHGSPDKESGAPLHDLTGGGNIYPDDVYSANGLKYYGTGDDSLDRRAFSLIQKFKGKPDAKVTIYRAVPSEPSNADKIDSFEQQKRYILKTGKLPPEAVGDYSNTSKYYDHINDEIDRLKSEPEPEQKSIDSINPGDWVSPVRQYIVDHGKSALKGKYKILKKTVTAKEVFTAGDSWLEWGYDPKPSESPESSPAVRPQIIAAAKANGAEVRGSYPGVDDIPGMVDIYDPQTGGNLSVPLYAGANEVRKAIKAHRDKFK